MAEPFLAEIKIWPCNFAPRGWAFCSGQLLSIAQNTALFSLLGTTYGGNGQTTFALPDLRSRLPMGVGQGPGLANKDLGEIAGSESATLLTSNLPALSLPASNLPANTENPTGAVPASGGAYRDSANASQASIGGSSQPFGILNPYLGLNFIIALEGIFPSRS